MSEAAVTTPPRFEDLPELCTVDEVAAFLRIGRNTAYELVKTQELPSLKFGRIIRIRKTALLGGK